MGRNNSKIYLVLVATVLLFRVNGWAQQSGAGIRSSQRPTGTITGRVVNSAGEPLSGAGVYASSLGSGARAQSVTADSNGEFKIDGLEAGLYRISGGMAGYLSPSLPTLNDSHNYYRIGDSVTLTLIKGAVITGTVTGPNGPLVGVGVFAIRVRDEDGKKLTASFGSRERSTDDRGVFRLYGLLPGAYLISAAKPRIGLIAPSAYDNDAPTYFPSATRDTAAEIIVRDGDEIAADIQYRAEPGHAVSGKVAGLVESQTSFSPGASIVLTDVQNRTAITSTGTGSSENYSFAIYGVPDGEYELSASQFLPTRDELKSAPRRVTVRGADVTGIDLTLAPQASIEGRIIFEADPRAGCAKRRDTAAQETMVYARRYEPEKKTGASAKAAELSDVSLSAANHVSLGVGDVKGSFTFRNLLPGSYRIDPRAPANGWYIRSITKGPANSAAARTVGVTTARDGVTAKSGERVSDLIVTITEGGASVSGRISEAEAQTLPPRLRVYLVPAEREAAGNVLRFYEARTEANRSFTVDNINPGKYWIVAQPVEENDGVAKSIRQDGAFRSKIVRDAEALKKDITLKPCEQISDYDLPYPSPPTSPQ